MKQKLAVLLALLLLLSATINVSAQSDYYFSVSREVVQVFWNEDGTLSLDYTWDFVNQPGAHSIDFVDVGMPNGDADMSTVQADVNGNRVETSTSDYQGNGSGFAVVLGSDAIPSGASGTVHVYVGRVANVLYEDSEDANLASAVFAPTYFGSQYVEGSTDLTAVFHLPPGVQPQEPKWHGAPPGFPSQPETGLDQNNRITYTWHNPDANVYSEYQFGASFPKSYVPAGSILTQPAFSFPQINFSVISNILCLCFFGFLFLIIPMLNAIAGNRRKMQYLPPKISIEGHGIKRGLTAVEAAVLMEQPLDKVMTMILFGAIKKNAAKVDTRDPLELSIASPLPDGLHDYELNFLEAFKETNLQKRRRLLQDMTVNLVKAVSEKMKGFSRRETLEFYQSITEKAWQQVEAADTPEVKSQKLDEALEWTMLDRNYDDRSRRVFTGPVYVPMWWGRYDPSWRGGPSIGSAPTVSTSAPSSSRGPAALPGADFAASVVGGVQTFSQKVIGNVNDFTSRVTKVTNPPPVSSGTGGSSRGGGGCACACACAGCACACAGGGR